MQASFNVLLAVLMFSLAQCDKLTDKDPIPDRIGPTMPSGKPQLTLKYFASVGGYAIPFGHFCSEGIKIAVDAIQRSQILADYDLSVSLQDSKCFIAEGLQMSMKFLRHVQDSSESFMPIYLGPVCESVDFVAVFLKHYNFIGLHSVVATKDIYLNRARYSSYFILRSAPHYWYHALPYFFEAQGWKSIYLLTEPENPLFLSYEEQMYESIGQFNISIDGVVQLKYPLDDLPPEEEVVSAVGQLSAMNARIIIVDSNFPSMIACQLFKQGMYGPGYVYLALGAMSFLPNTPLVYEDCTPERLAVVAQSFLYISDGTPLDINADQIVDPVGTHGQWFLDTLKERIEKPDNRQTWFFFKSACYSTVVASALALDQMEKRLQQGNDTLQNWATNGRNFKENGSYIHGELIDIMNNLKFQGFDSFEHIGMNSLVGVTGFFQTQLNFSFEIKEPLDLSEAMAFVPIASMDTSLPTLTLQEIPGKARWLTKDGFPPLDSLRVFAIWFNLDPVASILINNKWEMAGNDVSVAFQYYTYGCKLTLLDSTVSTAFMAELLVCYTVVIIPTLCFAVTLRKIKFRDVTDLALVRTAGYTVAVIVVIGGIAVALVFGNSPESMPIAVSVLALVINAVAVGILFLPKLGSRIYF